MNTSYKGTTPWANPPANAAPVGERRLTATCVSGLANRLRVLLSGLVMADVTERHFTMLWPRTRQCSADYDKLFVTPWNVRQAATEVCLTLPNEGIIGKRPNLTWLISAEPHLTVQHATWLYVVHPGLNQPLLHARAAQYLAQLELHPELQHRIDTFAAQHFRPTMIGVHLRRGDFVRKRQHLVDNTTLATAEVDRLLEQVPDAGILLCSDDGSVDQITDEVHQEGVHGIFARRYGSRVVRTHPRSLDRRTPVAIQDALIDLWLMRRTDYMVGTEDSSFSEMTVFGRTAPLVRVGAPTAAFRRIDAFGRWSGADYVLRRVPVGRRFSPTTPFPVIWQHYVSLLRRAVAKARRTLRD